MRKHGVVVIVVASLGIGIATAAKAQTINLTANDPAFGTANVNNTTNVVPNSFNRPLAMSNGSGANTMFVETGTGAGIFAGPSAFVSLDDTAFQAFLATEPNIAAGGSLGSVSAFVINVGAGTTNGTYTRQYRVGGGNNNEADNQIGIINFEVVINGQTPPPGNEVPEPRNLGNAGRDRR